MFLKRANRVRQSNGLPPVAQMQPYQSIVAAKGCNGKEPAEAGNAGGGQPMGGDAETAVKFLLASLGVAVGEAVPARTATIVAAAAEAMQSVIQELSIEPDEQRDALAGLFTVVEGRFPQIVAAMLVEALLPRLQERAFGHFRYKRRESDDDAFDLSQTMVTKILEALMGNWPAGNVGAWVAAIRENLYADHVRKRERGRQVFERIENTWRAMRR
jgi:hypothetical protein